MTTPSRLSVILTFYEQREFVAPAVESVLAQQRDGLEVIAVDDGSTDGTADLLRRYGDSLTPLLLERNGGVSAARSAGAAAAAGEYLAFLDGDDAFMPWTLDVYDRLIEERSPLAVIGRRAWFEGALPDPGPPPGEIRFIEHEDFFRRDRSITVGSSTLAIRRRSWEQVGGLHALVAQPGTPSLEELDLLWRLGDSGHVIQVLEPVTARYRAHPAQATRQTGKMIDAASILCLRERRGEYAGGRPRRLERRACVGGQVLYWALLGLKRRQYRSSLRLLSQNPTFALAALRMRGRRVIAGPRAPKTLPLRTAVNVEGRSVERC